MSVLNIGWRCLALSVLCLALGGCADSSSGVSGQTVAVDGTVTLADLPLPYAKIEFQSLDDERFIRTALVKDGKFAMDQERGLISGDYQVSVQPYDLEVEELGEIPAAERQQISAARNLIPEKYQQFGLLKASINTDKPQTLSFVLK